MPPLKGFSDNPLRTKEHVALAAESLLRPLLPYFSPGQSRIKFPIDSGAHFDDVAAQLEGFARPLWLVAAFLSDSEYTNTSSLQPWINGVRIGIDPSHEEYWGDIGDWDQRMVEAEILSFGLLAAPEAFYTPLTDESKKHLIAWLMGLNGKVMPENNWRWFRVLSNLALIKVCGVPRESVWTYIEQDLETVDKFYLGEGWSADGVWRPATQNPEEEGQGPNVPRGRHADYYSGSFAIQFSQMLYSKFADDLDPERAALFRDRARAFIRQFWTYFDKDGASIPFGRSLCYRFAMGAFYAVFAYVGLCDDSDDLLSHGAVKGMLLRHLRWWATHSEHTFWTDGTLNIGYLYPNMYMCEDYNSPQSPYWALKSLIVVALAANHPFWASEELPHPLSGCSTEKGVHLVRPARQILCNHPKGQHHFLLSSGQFCVWGMKATEAKYAKFAYSSAFGFSVPTGPLITQIAPDSTLALSQDNGLSWAVRWKSIGDTQIVDVPLLNDSSSAVALVSRWKPWENHSTYVETTLIPPTHRWPDWHLRIHRIRSNARDGVSFSAVEGGFAIDGRRKSDGRTLLLSKSSGTALSSTASKDGEAMLESAKSSLVISSSAGASGILDLSPFNPSSSTLQTSGEILKPDPNTNLMTTRTLIPTIKRSLMRWPTQEIVIATAVFAISSSGSEAPSLENIESRWTAAPKVAWGQDGQLLHLQ